MPLDATVPIVITILLFSINVSKLLNIQLVSGQSQDKKIH
jgi:hypothetical protein